jgi:hypothetical protein
MVLCVFLALVEVPVEDAGFFLAGAGAFLAGALLAGAVLAGGLLAGAVAAGGFSTGVVDWAAADDKKPAQAREKIPAKTATAERRTQTLPTTGS